MFDDRLYAHAWLKHFIILDNHSFLAVFFIQLLTF